jgi:acyl carrier protein
MATNNNELAEMEAFLCARLSDVLHIDKSSIDVEKRFSAYGLDSLDAVTLVFELEELLKRELPSTLLWDYPNIRECCNFIVGQSGGAGESARLEELAKREAI